MDVNGQNPCRSFTPTARCCFQRRSSSPQLNGIFFEILFFQCLINLLFSDNHISLSTAISLSVLTLRCLFLLSYLCSLSLYRIWCFQAAFFSVSCCRLPSVFFRIQPRNRRSFPWTEHQKRSPAWHHRRSVPGIY